jgi:hypothetical protein
MGGKPQTFEWRCKKKNGTLFWAEIGCRSAVFGGQRHLLSTFHDITIRKNAEASLITLSQSDALTGLANRGVFVTSLEHAMEVARRRNRGAAVCIAHAKVHRYPELTEQTVWEVFEAKRTARRRPCDGALVNRRFAQ